MKTETMTGRERVNHAIRHEAVDRMPIDLGVHFSTGISAFAYLNLRRYLGLSTDSVELIDCVQGLARVDEDVLDRFHVDTVLLNPPWRKTRRWQPRAGYEFNVPASFVPEAQKDGGWRVHGPGGEMYMPAGGYFFDGAWPDFSGLSQEEKLREYSLRAHQLYEETGRFTMMMGFSAYFQGLDFACDMLTDPELCMEQNEALLKANLAAYDEMNAAFGPCIGALEVNSDLGMQSGPMCSPDSYEQVCYPYLKRFCDHVHNTSDIKIFLHSCGSVYRLLPLIADAGVDILNPVQISAAEMDPGRLKREFGDRLCFWGGGCNTQRILSRGTPEDVRSNVRELISVFKPGSGFVFNQVHNIMGDVPPQNIVAMLDTAYENAW